MTSSGPSRCRTASRWGGLRSASSRSARSAPPRSAPRRGVAARPRGSRIRPAGPPAEHSQARGGRPERPRPAVRTFFGDFDERWGDAEDPLLRFLVAGSSSAFDDAFGRSGSLPRSFFESRFEAAMSFSRLKLAKPSFRRASSRLLLPPGRVSVWPSKLPPRKARRRSLRAFDFDFPDFHLFGGCLPLLRRLFRTLRRLPALRVVGLFHEGERLQFLALGRVGGGRRRSITLDDLVFVAFAVPAGGERERRGDRREEGWEAARPLRTSSPFMEGEEEVVAQATSATGRRTARAGTHLTRLLRPSPPPPSSSAGAARPRRSAPRAP